MHELSLAHAIVGEITESLGEGERLARIGLTVGRLSCVSPDSLSFCLEALLQQTGMGSPELEVSRSPALLRCRECGEQFGTGDMYTPCPACGGMRREVLAGRDLVVDYMEILQTE